MLRMVLAATAGLGLSLGGEPAVRPISDPPGVRSPKSAVVVAGAHYRAGPLHRWLFGDDYRELWTNPVRVEVLDLDRFAGGLVPVRRVGAGQSSGLAFRGADGRAYTFRGVEKDATRGLPPELRRTIAGRIAQDQTAALHPAAAVVADPLLEAVGVLHASADLVVMPDHPRLGEFRDFAGRIGTIQEYPRAEGEGVAFEGAVEIIDSRELLDRLRASPEDRVDARAYLRARLMDLFLGDWDRHLGQWRWARIPGREGWQPIPEDRDFAFCRFEGLVLAIARNWYPRWVAFGRQYPDVVGITWQAWPLDREVLTELDAAAWDAVAADVQSRLTDEVLEAAVARLPEEYRRSDGARLAAALRSRRDGLARAAKDFYRLLAEEVVVPGTDAAERAEVVAERDGGLRVRLLRADSPGGESRAWFERRFVPGETREVRIELRGGDDVFESDGASDVLVRVAGGKGDDALDDSRGGRARISDFEGTNRIRTGRTTSVDRRPYAPPPLRSEVPYMPARDWGREVIWLPWFAAAPDVGLFLGGGVRRDRFAYRTYPYRSRHVLRAGFAAGVHGFRADYDGELRFENSAPWAALSARASQIEILNFFGFGNDTDRGAPSSFFEVRQTRLEFSARAVVPLGPSLTASIGPEYERAWTRRPADRFIGQLRPYGSEPFGQLGIGAELRFDTRDEARAASGVLLAAGGSFHPALFDVDGSFGHARGEAAVHLVSRMRFRPTLALRAAFRAVFGPYPFHEAAFVGGPETVRGFPLQRFAGDTSAFGNAELRLALGRYFLVLPGEYGVFALADTGRVWLEGESSNAWHAGVGGGLWFAYLDRRNTVTVAAARSAEGTGFYVRTGFLF